MNAEVNGGVFTGSSDPITIGSLGIDTIGLSTQFTPDAIGNYTVVQSITADSLDDVPSNNEIANISFSVVDYIYARDNNDVGGSTSNGTDGFEAGNLFDIWADQTLKGIDVRIPGGTNGVTAGTEFFVKIYSLDTEGEFIYENESDPVLVTQQMLNTSQTIELLFPTDLFANTTYLAVVGSYEEGFRVSTAGASDPQTSFCLDLADNTWYYRTGTPVVRLNFDPTIGLQENSSSFKVGNVFPNPVDGEATLKVFMNNAQQMSLTITDLSGRIVYSENKTLQQGENNIVLDSKNLNSGIYTVLLNSRLNTISRKMVVK